MFVLCTIAHKEELSELKYKSVICCNLTVSYAVLVAKCVLLAEVSSDVCVQFVNMQEAALASARVWR